MKELNIKNYAHIGDAVYEVFIREKTIMMTSNLNKLHKLTVSYVNAGFQTELLEKLTPFLTDAELELSRRARNIPISSSRRTDRTLHASATSLEVIFGYNYIHNKERFYELCRLSEDIMGFSNEKGKI